MQKPSELREEGGEPSLNRSEGAGRQMCRNYVKRNVEHVLATDFDPFGREVEGIR